MKKLDFAEYINNQIEGLSIEDQEKVFKKISEEWIPEIISKRLEKYTFCAKCLKYSLTQDFKIITKREFIEKITCKDYDYPYGYKYGKVEYIMSYSLCPICNHGKEIRRKYIRILWKEKMEA